MSWNRKAVFVRVWSKCTAQHRMAAPKSALQLLCFSEKGLSQLLQICWCYFIPIEQVRRPRAVSFPICSCLPCTPCWELAEKLSPSFQSLLALRARSLQQGASKQAKLHTVFKWDCIRLGLWFFFLNLFWSTAYEREKGKQNLYGVKVGVSRLQSTRPDSLPSGRARRAQRGTLWMRFSLQRQGTLLPVPVLERVSWKTGRFARNTNH